MSNTQQQDNSSSPSSSSSSPDPQVQEAVRQAVESGDNVRERVHSLVVDLMRGPQGTLETLRRGVTDIMNSSVEIARRMPGDKSESVLRGVIDGVTSGVQSVAQAANYAVQEAAARGQRFAGEDLNRTVTDMNAISQIILESVAHASERLGSEVGTGVRELKTHAERAVEAIRPVLKETVSTMTQNPVQAATEVAGTAVRGGRLIAGTLLSAVSGILSGAAEAIDPDRNRKS